MFNIFYGVFKMRSILFITLLALNSWIFSAHAAPEKDYSAGHSLRLAQVKNNIDNRFLDLQDTLNKYDTLSGKDKPSIMKMVEAFEPKALFDLFQEIKSIVSSGATPSPAPVAVVARPAPITRGGGGASAGDDVMSELKDSLEKAHRHNKAETITTVSSMTKIFGNTETKHLEINIRNLSAVQKRELLVSLRRIASEAAPAPREWAEAAAAYAVPAARSGGGTSAIDPLSAELTEALRNAYAVDKGQANAITCSMTGVWDDSFANLEKSLVRLSESQKRDLLSSLRQIILEAAPAPREWAEAAAAYAVPAAPSILTAEEKRLIHTASDSLKAIADGTDVHLVNRTILAGYASDLQTVITRLGTPPTPANLEEIRTAATAFYAAGAQELPLINRVINSINPGSRSGELGITAYDALWRAHVLAQRCDAVIGKKDFLPFALKMISQNIEEGGGCVDGIVGRAIVVQIKCLQFLRDNFLI